MTPFSLADVRPVRLLVGLGVLLALLVSTDGTTVLQSPGARRATRPTVPGGSGVQSGATVGPTERPQVLAPAPTMAGSVAAPTKAGSVNAGSVRQKNASPPRATTGQVPGGAQAAAARPQGSAATRATLTLASLAATGAEFPNPFRGSYQWLGNPPQPVGWPIVDSYDRVGWRALEPQEGTYDFTSLDQQLAQAQARGGKLGLRLMPACTGCAPSSIEVPDYLKALMPQGFWFRLNGTDNYAPDWNSDAYLDRLNLLLQALGRRYDGDPRLGWVEISGYGDWGEWHTSNWPYPSSTGATAITDANALKIVDMNVAAFPHKRLLMLHDHEKALAYALSLSPAIGIRNDCLGDQWFTDSMTALAPITKDRWKTAPIITEYCYQRPQSSGFRLAADQIQTFHVAMIGNGNMDPLSSFSAGDQSLFVSNNESAGYRFILHSVNIPSSLPPGSSFTLSANWSNLGVTPSYSQWKVLFRLSDPATGAVVWQAQSGLALSTFGPTRDGTGDHPVTVTDTGALPATLRPGTYNLSVLAVDPVGYYQPLELAIGGRRPDGSYPVGTATVG